MKFKGTVYEYENVSIREAVTRSIQDAEGGAVEQAATMSHQAADAIGKLTQFLHENGHLTDEQVRSLVNYLYTEQT